MYTVVDRVPIDIYGLIRVTGQAGEYIRIASPPLSRGTSAGVEPPARGRAQAMSGGGAKGRARGSKG